MNQNKEGERMCDTQSGSQGVARSTGVTFGDFVYLVCSVLFFPMAYLPIAHLEGGAIGSHARLIGVGLFFWLDGQRVPRNNRTDEEDIDAYPYCKGAIYEVV